MGNNKHRLGFVYSTQKETKKATNSATNEEKFIHKKIESLIDENVSRVNQLRSELLNELTTLNHVQSNLAVYQQQVNYIESLFEKRDVILRQLIEDFDVPPSMLNKVLCKKHLELIKHLDRELNPLVSTITNELNKYKLTDIHLLTLKQEITEKDILSIHRDASRLDHRVRELQSKHNSFESFLQSVQNTINTFSFDSTSSKEQATRYKRTKIGPGASNK